MKKYPASRSKLCTILLFLSIYACTVKQENTTATQQAPEKNITPEIVVPSNTTISQVKTSQLIVPGKSIGLTKLQEKVQLVMARLGKPDLSNAAMGKALATWVSKPAPNATDTTRHQTTIYFTTNMGAPDEASRVNQIRVTSPYFLTKDSVQVNSNWSFIQKQYPEAIKAASYKLPNTQRQVLIYDAVAAGIAFEVNEQGRCIAITIHQPKQDIRNFYLPLFPDMERF